MRTREHEMNHVLFSPNNKTIVFMHRWTGSLGRRSRLLVYCRDSDELKVVGDSFLVSHYAWTSSSSLLVWCNSKYGSRYITLNTDSGEITPFGNGVLAKIGDGHPAIAKEASGVVIDTYPDRGRVSRLFGCDVHGEKIEEIGEFLSPWKFRGTVRTDLHPRISPDANWVSVDCCFNGFRQMYLAPFK